MFPREANEFRSTSQSFCSILLSHRTVSDVVVIFTTTETMNCLVSISVRTLMWRVIRVLNITNQTLTNSKLFGNWGRGIGTTRLGREQGFFFLLSNPLASIGTSTSISTPVQSVACWTFELLVSRTLRVFPGFWVTIQIGDARLSANNTVK